MTVKHNKTHYLLEDSNGKAAKEISRAGNVILTSCGAVTHASPCLLCIMKNNIIRCSTSLTKYAVVQRKYSDSM